MEEGAFYITLPCNASSNIYPENTISSYTTKLAKPVHLAGPFEVALTEIQYPHTWNTFEQHDGNFFIGKPGSVLKEYYVKSGFYSSINDLVRAINERIDNLKLTSDGFKLRYDDVKRTVSVTESPALQFVPGQKLSNILGLPAYIETSVDNHPAGRKRLYSDIKSGFYTLFVYTDIIQHQLVGDGFVQLLRSVEIGGKNNEIVTMQYTRPDYVPLCRQHFDSITISILTDQGVPVKFKYGKSIVRLHFRPRKALTR